MDEGVRTSLNHAEAGGSAAQPLISLERIAVGGFAEAEASIDGDAESLLLYRDETGVRAWLNICPHAGRRLDWAPGQFLKSKDGLLVCAAHGASFELGGGTCVAGPCRGEALRAIAVAVRDGAVWLA
ncbi:MAG: Rieske 2Fe-2S domain-containing protein [Lysobacter sp.]|nr:Rieske 2Fe-2S domain-containing protein [Lysobacter sp.]